MATSSITTSFVISGKEQVEMFINAIEESAKEPPQPATVTAHMIREPEEFKKFMEDWKKAHAEDNKV